MDRTILRVLIPTLYVVAAIVAYVLDFHTSLNILALPWSAFLIIIAGVTSHGFPRSNSYIDIIKIFAVVLNVAAFLALIKKTDRR